MIEARDLALFQEKFGPLVTNEELVWLGKPGHVRDWNVEQILVVVVNLIGLLLIGFWEIGHLQTPPWLDPQAGPINWLAPVAPLPVAVFCLYMMAPRIYLRRWLRTRMTYAVTSLRVLSDERGLIARHQTLWLKDLLKFRCRRENSGLKDYVFLSRRGFLVRKFILFEAVYLPSQVIELVSK